MNADMKKLRKALLHGRARHFPVLLGFGSDRTRWAHCRRWRVVPIPPGSSADNPLLWPERLAKLANRATLR
jgi:hypothetical protein